MLAATLRVESDVLGCTAVPRARLSADVLAAAEGVAAAQWRAARLAEAPVPIGKVSLPKSDEDEAIGRLMPMITAPAAAGSAASASLLFALGTTSLVGTVRGRGTSAGDSDVDVDDDDTGRWVAVPVVPRVSAAAAPMPAPVAAAGVALEHPHAGAGSPSSASGGGGSGVGFGHAQADELSDGEVELVDDDAVGVVVSDALPYDDDDELQAAIAASLQPEMDIETSAHSDG